MGLKNIFNKMVNRKDDEKQKEMFDLFDENIYCHVDFNIDMVLFDPVNGEILNTKRVTK